MDLSHAVHNFSLTISFVLRFVDLGWKSFSDEEIKGAISSMLCDQFIDDETGDFCATYWTVVYLFPVILFGLITVMIA